MSLWQNILLRLWPRHTMRVAYWQWQSLDNMLAEAHQGLERQYLATRSQAEQGLAEVHLGILRQARTVLDQPPDPGMTRVQERLQRAFARRGRGFCRGAPEPLQMELSHFNAGVRKICRSYGKLAAGLKLAQEIIGVFAGNPEFCRAHFFQLALISPESARLLYHLRNQRLGNRRAIQDFLPRNCPPV